MDDLASSASLTFFLARYFSFIIVTYVSTPRRFAEKIATMIAIIVTIVETAPVTARPPAEKRLVRSGVSKVVPQVGQPAPSAMRPATMPALPRFSAF